MPNPTRQTRIAVRGCATQHERHGRRKAPGPSQRKRLLALVTMLLMAPPNVAQGQILHEFFTYTEERPAGAVGADRPGLPEPGLRARPGLAAGDRGHAMVFRPGGIAVDGRLSTVGLPSENAPAGPSEPVELDTDTRREGVLRYVEVFEPSVAPWKRVGARDAPLQLGDTWTLGIADSSLRPVPVGGAPSATDTAFVARWTIEGTPDTLVPIASVAPEMRIHRTRSAPDATLRFFRDGAGNFFVQVREGGLVAVTAEVSAPTRYFDSRLPPSSARSSLSPPEALAHDARRVARHLGLDPDRTSDAAIVDALRTWFLGFEAGALPETARTGNDFLDIAFGRRGVCRHRAFAFVLAARGLGLDARLVYNEAHAFVEVHIAGDGWRRVDLGGEAEAFEFFGDPDVPLHTPPGEDPATHDPAAVAAGHRGTSVRPLDEVAAAREQAEHEQRMRHRPPEALSASPGTPDDVGAPGSSTTDPWATPPQEAPSAGPAPPADSLPDGERAGEGAAHEVDAGAPGTGAPAAVSKPEDAPPADSTHGGGTPVRNGSAHPREIAADSPESDSARAETLTSAPRSGPDAQPPSAMGDGRAEPEPRPADRVVLEAPEGRAMRGASLEVSGAIRTPDGQPAPNRTVAIVLRPPGAGDADAAGLVLGTGRTDASGRYALTVRIPATLPPGHWTIAATLPPARGSSALPTP